MKTPIGFLHVESKGDVLTALEFHDRPGSAPRGAIQERLEAYFRGDLSALEEIEVEIGGTPFQHLVWEELRRIPVGETISYGELARRIGRPKAVRAVGAANGQNPIGLVVPCHRVIGADGSLTGYGGGLPRKEWLLAHERSPALPLFGALSGARSGDPSARASSWRREGRRIRGPR